MRFILSVILTGVISLLAAQEQYAGKLSSVALRDPDHLEVVIKGNNNFAFNLYQQLKSKKGNLFFSPYNIAEGFAMASVGAQITTATEFEKVFQYGVALAPLNGDLGEILSVTPPVNNKTANELSIAANAWIQKGVSLTAFYQQSIKQNFNSNLEQVDFIHEPLNAVKVINQWISTKTNGRISQLITSSDVSSNTRLMLTTAIYMKGSWQHPFELKLTNKATFHTNSKYSISVEMMHASERFLYMSDPQVTMIELPYVYQSDKGAALAMQILLPTSVDGLEKLESQFNMANWNVWSKKLSMKKVNLAMPRFRDEEKIDLNHAMNKLGLVQAFTDKANFAGITGEPDLHISKAIHKTFIRVDERGTEAAAATVIGMNTTSIDVSEPIEMVVDHPFLFLIVDKKTNSIVFVGRISQP